MERACRAVSAPQIHTFPGWIPAAISHWFNQRNHRAPRGGGGWRRVEGGHLMDLLKLLSCHLPSCLLSLTAGAECFMKTYERHKDVFRFSPRSHDCYGVAEAMCSIKHTLVTSCPPTQCTNTPRQFSLSSKEIRYSAARANVAMSSWCHTFWKIRHHLVVGWRTAAAPWPDHQCLSVWMESKKNFPRRTMKLVSKRDRCAVL